MCTGFNSFGKYQGSWLLDHMVGVCLLSWETAKLSSKVSIPFCVPTSNEWEFLFLHILVSVCCCQFLVLLILMDMWWYLNVAFYFLSPKTNDFKYFFHDLIGHFSLLSVKCMLKYFLHCYFILLLLTVCVHILDIFFVWYMYCEYFSQYLACLIFFSMVRLKKKKNLVEFCICVIPIDLGRIVT